MRLLLPLDAPYLTLSAAMTPSAPKMVTAS
jgi:hypothetical protein